MHQHLLLLHSYRGYKQEMKEQPDDVLIDLIARYGHTMLRAKDELEKYVKSSTPFFNIPYNKSFTPFFLSISSKRTVDFGLSRGYSGENLHHKTPITQMGK